MDEVWTNIKLLV